MIERRNAANLLFLGITAAAVYLCFLLFRPYVTPILFASVIAIVFYPLHRYTQRISRSPNVSAFVSTLVTLLLTVVPLTFLLIALSNELTGLYQALAARSAGSGGVTAYLLQGSERLMSWASSRFSIRGIDVRAIVMNRLENISSSLLRYGANLVSNLFSLVANAAIALIVVFFLFRDGKRVIGGLMQTLPIGQERIPELSTRIQETVKTNFYGSFVVGALQGTLAGLSFWALGIDSPVLWGIASAVFSLIPFLGTAIVWVPASIVLLLTGHVVKGIILLGLGTALIGTVDNIVRPLIIHRSVRLHPLLVLFSILGGLRLLGVLGLFVGPVILSVTAALLHMLREDMAAHSSSSPSSERSDVHAAPAHDK
jgi:predicted PurR-regulated permease PerM